MRFLLVPLLLCPQAPEWTSSKEFYKANLLAGADRWPMAGWWLRVDPKKSPWPELLKDSDRHSQWGHNKEAPGSFGAMGEGEIVRREDGGDAFSRKLTYALKDGRKVVFSMTRSSPALWMESDSNDHFIFKSSGKGMELGLPTAQGMTVTQGFNGSNMTESWFLVWRGRHSGVNLSFVPSFLHATPNPIDREDFEKYVKPQPADEPWLVVLQKRPEGVVFKSDSLLLHFKEGAGKMAFLPLSGMRWERGNDLGTDAWQFDFPKGVMDRCRRWSRILKHFPESFAEEYSVDGDSVRVRTTFKFTPIADDWKTEGLKLAPLSPVTALALASGLKNLGVDAKFVDLDYPTLTGIWGGFEQVDAYTVTFRGWKKYGEPPAPRGTSHPDARVQRKLEAHLRDMIEAGPLAPYESFQGTMQYSFWGNPGDLASTLLAARRHVGPDLQKGIDDYLKSELVRYPILKVGWTPAGEGARREGHPVDLGVKDIVGRRRKEEPARIENLYGLWESGGDFTMDAVRTIVHARDDCLDWELGFHKGGVMDLNQRIKGLAGYLQLAGKKSDAKAEDEAAFLLTQALVNRFAFAKLNESLYRTGQYVVPKEFDLPRFHARNAHKFNVFLPAYKRGADYRTAAQAGWIGTTDRYLSEIGNFWHDHAILAWAELTPPLAEFLRDTTRPELENYRACIEEGLPTWYVAKAENLHAIGEDAYFSPLMSWPVFQAKAMIFREPGAALARFVDLPYGRGDLYYLQNLVAVLEAE